MNFQKGCILMEEVIKCQNLTKKFGQELIFEDLSFAINKGEIFVILGKNGAGDSDIMMTDTINPLKSKFKGFHKTFKQDDLGLSLSSFLLN